MSVTFSKFFDPHPAQARPSGVKSAASRSNQAPAPSVSIHAAAFPAIRGSITASPQSAHVKAVMGTPQVRWREMHQSGRFSIIP